MSEQLYPGKLGIPKYKSKPKRKYIKVNRPLGPKYKPLTADTPLSILEAKFIKNYIECGDSVQALKNIGVTHNYNKTANTVLEQPNVQVEIQKVMDEIKDSTIMDAREVMQYFSAVARGEIKDQFGLDAPLAERTKAAIEIAKRTADIELKRELQEAANEAPVAVIKLIRD